MWCLRVRNTESLKILEFVYFISLFNSDFVPLYPQLFSACKIGFFAMTLSLKDPCPDPCLVSLAVKFVPQKYPSFGGSKSGNAVCQKNQDGLKGLTPQPNGGCQKEATRTPPLKVTECLLVSYHLYSLPRPRIFPQVAVTEEMWLHKLPTGRQARKTLGRTRTNTMHITKTLTHLMIRGFKPSVFNRLFSSGGFRVIVSEGIRYSR